MADRLKRSASGWNFLASKVRDGAVARASQGEAIVNHEIAMSRLASARRLREARQAEFARWSADIAADEQRVAAMEDGIERALELTSTMQVLLDGVDTRLAEMERVVRPIHDVTDDLTRRYANLTETTALVEQYLAMFQTPSKLRSVVATLPRRERYLPHLEALHTMEETLDFFEAHPSFRGADFAVQQTSKLQEKALNDLCDLGIAMISQCSSTAKDAEYFSVALATLDVSTAEADELAVHSSAETQALSMFNTRDWNSTGSLLSPFDSSALQQARGVPSPGARSALSVVPSHASSTLAVQTNTETESIEILSQLVPVLASHAQMDAFVEAFVERRSAFVAASLRLITPEEAAAGTGKGKKKAKKGFRHALLGVGASGIGGSSGTHVGPSGSSILLGGGSVSGYPASVADGGSIIGGSVVGGSVAPIAAMAGVLYTKSTHPFLGVIGGFVLVLAWERKICEAILPPAMADDVFSDAVAGAVDFFVETGELVLGDGGPHARSHYATFATCDVLCTMRERVGDYEQYLGPRGDDGAALDRSETLRKPRPRRASTRRSEVRPEIPMVRLYAFVDRLADGLKDRLTAAVGDIRTDNPKSTTVDCTVHQVTANALAFLSALFDYSEWLDDLLPPPDWVPGSRGASVAQLDGNQDDVRPNDLFASYIVRALAALEDNLNVKAAAYKSEQKRAVFLLNNLQYMLDHVRGSEIGDVVPREGARLEAVVAGAMERYLDATWDGVVDCLAGVAVVAYVDGHMSKSDRKVVREGVSAFNAAFERVFDTQRDLAVPDADLRRAMKAGSIARVVDTYADFVDQYRDSPAFTDKTTKGKRLLKFKASTLRDMIMRFFGGMEDDM